jgi:hypothetical protein
MKIKKMKEIHKDEAPPTPIKKGKRGRGGGGVVVVQLDLVWLVCGSVGVCLSYKREDRVRSSTCGWWALNEG